MKHCSIYLFLFLLTLLFTSCNERKEEITVFHAGSLSVPFKAMADAYEKQHPDVRVLLEGAGSLTCIRKITELDKPCDILAVADHALIDELMIPGYAKFNIRFAKNEMALGYLPDSRWADSINLSNWHSILLYEDVHYGRSDPNHDPSGYRTEILAGLFERQTGIEGFQEQLLSKDRKFIRPKGTELLPLLETGAIDLIFHYRSVLLQHNLSMLLFPDSLNLSNPELNDWYSGSCVEVQGASKDEKIIKCGEAMVYGICLPDNGTNFSGARDFMRFILTDGLEILKLNGQPPLTPEISERSVIIPEWFPSI